MRRSTLAAGLAVAVLFGALALAQAAFDLKELVAYRLTPEGFGRFDQATRLMAASARHDPAFPKDPLFNREIDLSGDAPLMAAALQARLEKEPIFTSALRAAGMEAREYTKFALTLLAARLAHGFVEAGVLARVPADVPTSNVKFVDEHQPEIARLLEELRVLGAQP